MISRLPRATVDHLIDASRHRHAREWDYCKVSLCKCVESLFVRILVPGIQALPESSKLTIALPRGKQAPRKRSSEEWHNIPMSGWGPNSQDSHGRRHQRSAPSVPPPRLPRYRLGRRDQPARPAGKHRAVERRVSPRFGHCRRSQGQGCRGTLEPRDGRRQRRLSGPILLGVGINQPRPRDR